MRTDGSPETTQPRNLTEKPYVRVRAHDDAPQRIIRQGLINAVDKLFASQLDIDLVEYLTFGTAEGQEYFIAANVATVPDRSGGSDTGQQTLASLSDQSDPATGSLMHGAQVVMDKLREQIPVQVDVEPVRLDFAPVGQSAVTTSRFATEENVRIPSREDADPQPPFESLLRTLTDEPYLYQVLISKRNRTEYKIATRVALCAPSYQVQSHADLANVVTNGRDYYPVDHFSGINLTSNLKSAESELRVGSFDQVEKAMWSEATSRQALIDLVRGYPEFRDLKRGRIDYRNTYDELDLIPSFLIRQRDLELFMGLPLIKPGDNPWENTGRSHPDWVTINLESRMGAIGTDDTPTQPSPTSPKDGTAEHWKKVNLVAQIMEERGHDAHVVDQTEGDSINDVWINRTDDDPLIAEITNKSKSKPAGILKNVIRAEQWGCDVWMVGVNKSTAKRIADTLYTPYNDTRPDRTLLYTHNGLVSTSDGKTRLLPKGESEAHWWLTPDGNLELRDEADSLLGRHPATDSLAAADLPTPRYYRDDGTYVVEDADGTILHRYQTKEALLAEWTQLHKPLVPTRLTYIDQVPIKYVSKAEDDIKTYRPSADWDIPQHAKRYKEALEQYFELFTASAGDDKLPVPTVRDHARSVMASLSEHKTPGNEWFGRKEPERIKTDEMTGEAETQHYQNLTWRYPREIVSPTLPEFDAPTYPDDWDDDPA